MAKKKKTLEFTEAQLNAFFQLVEDTEAGVGCSDRDVETNKQLRLIYRMLKCNGYDIQ